jgi:hypothetical protein
MRDRSFTLFFPLFAALAAGASALATAPAHAQTYRWVDKNGTVHYSDRPQPGAQQVDLPKAQTYRSPPSASAAPSGVGAASGVGPQASCAIIVPSSEQTFVNQSSVTVSYRGPSGATATLLLNGQPSGGTSSAGSIRVDQIARGTYQAVVAFAGDSPGTELCRTAPVTFHVRQASLLSPARPAGAGAAAAPRAPTAPR